MYDLNPGFVVGSYRIIRELGKGGMGAVYEVEHVTLGVHYALKTYQPKRKRNRLSFQRTVLHSGDSVELIGISKRISSLSCCALWLALTC